MVAIVLKPGLALAPEALLDYCTGKMAHFAIPRYVRFMDALPRNHAERVQKTELRADGITADTWDRESVGYKIKR
jgi:crotonobetaine/carnitine-CoA ligase